MATFVEFYKALLELAKKYQENTHIKIESDFDSDIIKIYGEKISSLARAKNGLEDVEELALTTAEHHPYWNLLYQCSQISRSTLEKWDEELSEAELEEINWSIEELKNAFKKLKKKYTN